jgi:hypothetical protein
MLLTEHKMSLKVRSASELRKLVAKILMSPIPDGAWQYAVNQRMVSDVLQGEDTILWLAKQLRAIMDIPEQQPRATPEFITPGRRQRRGKTVHGRREAISEALAAIARQSEEVRSFRSTVLNGQLLKFEDVEQWIEERRRDEIYPHALIVRLKPGFTLNYRDGWQLEPPLSSVGPDEIEGLVPVDSLDYTKAGSNWVQCVPIGRNGNLRIVFKLSKALAERCRWQVAQATMFLLTDMTPLLAMETVGFSPPPWTTLPYGRQLLPLSCLTRVTLTVDPMMTPREVSEKYAKVRAKLFVRKPRAQSEKHLNLAVFAVKHPALNNEARLEWEREFPKWKYPRLSLFARDARVARNRLLHESAIDMWRSLVQD